MSKALYAQRIGRLTCSSCSQAVSSPASPCQLGDVLVRLCQRHGCGGRSRGCIDACVEVEHAHITSQSVSRSHVFSGCRMTQSAAFCIVGIAGQCHGLVRHLFACFGATDAAHVSHARPVLNWSKLASSWAGLVSLSKGTRRLLLLRFVRFQSVTRSRYSRNLFCRDAA